MGGLGGARWLGNQPLVQGTSSPRSHADTSVGPRSTVYPSLIDRFNQHE